MRTLRRITAATALAAASLVVPAAHAAPPVPDVPQPSCEMFDVPHTGVCALLPHDAFYVTPCEGVQTVRSMSGADNIWAFSGGVGGGQWVGSVTTHCYVGSLKYGAKSDPVPGRIGFL